MVDTAIVSEMGRQKNEIGRGMGADPCIPPRWRMIFLLASGIAINYALRVNVSVAAVKMEDALGWTERQKGLLFSSFYIGYAMGQMPSAFSTHWFGARWLFGLSILLPSLLSLIFPAAIKYSYGLGLFVRALIGLAASAAFPSCYYFYKSWIPKTEKTAMISTIMAGLYFGEIVCFSVSGILVSSPDMGGWPSAFWVFGLVGIVWFPLWALLSYEKPEDCPLISPSELSLIRNGFRYTSMADVDEEQAQMTFTVDDRCEYHTLLSSELEDGTLPAVTTTLLSYQHHEGPSYNDENQQFTHAAAAQQGNTTQVNKSEYPNATAIIEDTKSSAKELARRIPWGFFLAHPASRTLLFAYWVMSWIGYMMLSEIPSFLTDQLGYEIEEAGIVAILPYFAQFVSALGFGQIFSILQRDHGWSTRGVRQAAQFTCFAGSGICLVLCGAMKSIPAALFFLIIALFLYGATQSGLACAFLDVSPNYSCSLNSLANLIGALAGISAPLVVSAMVSTFGGAGWVLSFLLTLLQCIVALFFWYKYQTSEIVAVLNSPRPLKYVNYKECCPWFRM